MNHYIHRGIAAALTLVVCLTVSPNLSASEKRVREITPRERVVRVIQQIQKFFGVSVATDFPNPPKP